MSEKSLIKKVLLAFEQSTTTIQYSKVYIYNDGPGDIKQLTLSFGITEYGNLKKLIQSYIISKGKLSNKFSPYLDSIGKNSLVRDDNFISLLKESGEDPLMQMCQDKAFDEYYITPAYNFCLDNKLNLNLSKLVICDSFLQSGSILSFLRNRFPEKIPVNGGDEKLWVKSYCKTRREWLSGHSRLALRDTVYRMDFMIDLIEKNDWGLTQSSYNANGVKIII